MKKTKILAISPGTRYLGTVIFSDSELIYWAVKTINSSKITAQSRKIRKILTNLIVTYQPDLVAQEKLFYVQCRKSEKLKQLHAEIKQLANANQLSYVEYSPFVVRSKICDKNKATKKEAFTTVCALYPELIVKAKQEKIGNDIYWDKMLNAAALGLYCLQKMKRTNSHL